MDKHSCEGCRTYVNSKGNIPLCDLNPIKEGAICPCTSCLIKGMCNTICDLFAIYQHLERYKEMNYE